MYAHTRLVLVTFTITADVLSTPTTLGLFVAWPRTSEECFAGQPMPRQLNVLCLSFHILRRHAFDLLHRLQRCVLERSYKTPCTRGFIASTATRAV